VTTLTQSKLTRLFDAHPQVDESRWKLGESGSLMAKSNGDRLHLIAYYPSKELIGKGINKLWFNNLRRRARDLGYSRISLDACNDGRWWWLQWPFLVSDWNNHEQDLASYAIRQMIKTALWHDTITREEGYLLKSMIDSPKNARAVYTAYNGLLIRVHKAHKARFPVELSWYGELYL
jgi:hypothetical protein